MWLETFLDIVAGVFFVLGAVLSLVAAFGLVVFPDLLSRMHAATKPQILGILLLLVGLALELRSWNVLGVLGLVWVFQLLAVPVSAHMVGRAGYRMKRMGKEYLVLDELDVVVGSFEED